MTIHVPCICVKETGTVKGRGAFSTRRFLAGEVVETCPVILFAGSTKGIPSEIRKILFNWSVLADSPASNGLVLGYGSIYNHDNPANMRYEADAAASTMRYVAVRDIALGEELTINYNAYAGGHESAEDNWFKGMRVTPYQGP